MRERIICPFHDEKTPSMVNYDTHWYCFGCASTMPIEGGVRKESINKYKEQLEQKLAEIRQLPHRAIRGFNLPYDSRGYYVLYPNADYYVLRTWDDTTATKYRCPSGQKKPLYIEEGNNKLLFVVEGQMNAKTLAVVTPATVISPGGCTELNKPDTVNYCLQYDNICIIVDKDAPGVVWGLELKEALLKHKKRVALYPMPADFNSLLVDYGKDAVIQRVCEAMDLLGLQELR